MAEEMIRKKSGSKTLDLVYAAAAAALIAVCSWITVPGEVPFTLQTFAVFFALYALGGKRGTVAVIVYILLGAVGLPVFSGFKGGIGAILGTTGGYIVGFVFSALIVWLTERWQKNIWLKILFSAAALAVCYAFGTLWFLYVYARNTGPVSVITALSWCVFPFIPFDAAKLAIAMLLASRLKKHIK